MGPIGNILGAVEVDAPTERFRPVVPPHTRAMAASALPGTDSPECRLLAGQDAFDVFMTLPMTDRLMWTFGEPDPAEPTPIWDAVLLGLIDLEPDGVVFNEIMARFEDMAPDSGVPSGG